MVLEKTLKNPLDSKEIELVNPKGNQSWIFTGRTDAEAAAPILWPAIWRTDSLEKILMLGKIEGRRWRGRQWRIVGWHHWLDGREFEQAPGVGDGQGSLAYYSPWGWKELDMTEVIWWPKNKYMSVLYFFKALFIWLCWVFVAAHRVSLVAVSRGYSQLAVCGFLNAVASLLQSTGSGVPGLSSWG